MCPFLFLPPCANTPGELEPRKRGGGGVPEVDHTALPRTPKGGNGRRSKTTEYVLPLFVLLGLQIWPAVGRGRL